MSEDNNNNNVQVEEDKVRIRFITNDENIRVTETPFGVPVRLGRLGLSEVVNHLRSSDASEHRPFDFLINGRFVRTSLEKHIKQAGLSEEPVINEKENQHDDWISSLDGCLSSGLIVTGSYDLGTRVVNGLDGATLLTTVGHSAPVKSVAWVNSQDRSQLEYVSASHDMTIRLWSCNLDQKTYKTRAIFQEHTGTVESVSVSPDGSKMVSGAMDSKIKLWDLKNIKSSSVTNPTQSKKKRKTTDTTTTEEEPDYLKEKDIQTVNESITSLEGHTQGVLSVCWPTQFQILTGGMDHGIKLWDIETMTCTDTIRSGGVAIHDVTYSTESTLIATAQAEKTVRIWDPRVSDGKYNVQSMLSHKSWVTSIRWHPTSQNQLVSSSHDGTVKFWDIRTKIPLYTLDKHTDKVLCVGWSSNSSTSTNPSIVSGGADSKLKIYK
ncbi:WD40 repeat-containing protein [Cavenderia fasciculata]|uniref:Ribosome biogenesis protein WDR12 homolog n=1 Tax=Cavenderia fasciculata TaxID=261658 RepID=F4Q1W1_CACFS|nr:WD40 repeat-containing protein [Cavenderia fasciculata]EGG17981.1 WD40 repeat-containing protein [Cavenderia fasciculata]|eukprot:XP_004356873.1 WD40 repeat-containing protein [Cavenderia fasciculata]